MKREQLASGRNFHISAFRFHISEAEIRRPHFALLGFEVAATPKLVRSIKTKEERIMDLLGELEVMLEGKL